MDATLDPQQQADADALASAVGAAAHQLGLDEHASHHAHSLPLSHQQHPHPHSLPHTHVNSPLPHSQPHSHVGTPTPTHMHTHHQTQSQSQAQSQSQSQADEDNAFLAHQLNQQSQSFGGDQHHPHGRGNGDGGSGIGVGVGVGVGMGLDDGDIDLSALEIPMEHHQHSNDNSGHPLQQAHLNAQQSFHIPSPPMQQQQQQQHHQQQQQHNQQQVHLNLNLDQHQHHQQQQQSTFVRPPSIRKACDLCHAAKQKCSGDRPTCTRCLAGGWACHYAPRQRRRTLPKDRQHGRHGHYNQHHHNQHHDPALGGIAESSDQDDVSSPLGVGIDGPHGVGPNAVHAAKKRKIDVRRNSLTFENGLDLKTAMGMALDMGMANEDEGEEILTMSNEAMLEVIAVDGYIADLPLATFVNNLPYTAPPAPTHVHTQPSTASGPSSAHPPIGVGVGVGLGSGVDDYGTDAFQGDMDQHTTSALRDAIFSLNNESVDVGGTGEGEGLGDVNDGDMDPHLALLDLSHLPEEGEGLEGLNLPANLGLGVEGEGEGDAGVNGQTQNGSNGHAHASHQTNTGEGDHSDLLSMHLGCNHPEMVPHLLALLIQHPLDPKPNANTPLTMPLLAPLARAIRTFHNIAICPSCMASPQQTLPQLALISRLATILTFPCPPSNSGQIPGAQIVLHGARLTGTGISDHIEQHIVHVVWDSWRASIREVFMIFERQARDVIAHSATAASLQREKEAKARAAAANGSGGGQGEVESEADAKSQFSGVETQRAGLFFQAMSRLKQAVEEVEQE